jgi:hypothetical protein
METNDESFGNKMSEEEFLSGWDEIEEVEDPPEQPSIQGDTATAAITFTDGSIMMATDVVDWTIDGSAVVVVSKDETYVIPLTQFKYIAFAEDR